MTEQTLGQKRVRMSFNPSNKAPVTYSRVDLIKEKAADLIDLCEQYKDAGPFDRTSKTLRLLSLAQTHFEDAAMWAVKAVTA